MDEGVLKKLVKQRVKSHANGQKGIHIGQFFKTAAWPNMVRAFRNFKLKQEILIESASLSFFFLVQCLATMLRMLFGTRNCSSHTTFFPAPSIHTRDSPLRTTPTPKNKTFNASQS